MKVGALILGILGGLILLSFGLIGYGLGSLADAGKAGTGSAMKIISLGIPISALVGAGMVMAKPILGSCLMSMSAVAFLLMAGFNFFSLIPLVLLGISALLGFSSAEKSEKKINTENLNKDTINKDTNNSYSSSVSNNYEPGARIPNFDQSKWAALLKYDADIALIADRIRPYGQKWLNEFASSYLALNDKKYLSDIEQKITSAAKKEIEYKKEQELALAKAEAKRREQIRIRDEEHREQLLKEKERRAQIQRERAKFWQDWFSRNKKIITISCFIIILIASIATFLWFRNLKIKEEQIRLTRETAENLAQKFVKENLITCNGISYIKINNVIAKLNQDVQVAIHEADENWNFASFEVWSSGDDLQYEGDKGWVKNDLLLFGMIQKYGQWVQKDIKKISCSDIQERTVIKNHTLPNPLPPSSSNHTDSVHQNLADTAIAHTSENSYKSSQENKNPWIFSDSDKRYLTDNEIKNLPTDDLWKARNEIYAKKGYIFNTDRGRQYAQSLGSFYSGIETDVKKIYKQLNTYEKYNVKLIQQYEK